MLKTLLAASVAALVAGSALARVDLGPRPIFLIDQLEEGALKEKLKSCANMDITPRLWSIGHRGAALQFPEHTAESYTAGARMGAGIIECDVTFTRDKELVCRHAQNDLHTTTNILATDLAAKCVKPFAVTDGKASAECRTAELTLDEFMSLTGKMDAADKTADTVAGYMNGTPKFRTDLYASQGGTLMTHKESIALIRDLGAKFTPELKDPAVEMPFDGFSMDDYAQKMIDEYKEMGVPASDVWAQSFNLDVIKYWIENEPEFGKQAVFLDDRYDDGIDIMDAATFKPSMQDLADMGVRYIAPPMWMLLTVKDGELAPSVYAEKANEAGLKIISWSLERSGPLNAGGGWYYQSIKDVTDSDAMVLKIMHALNAQVGVVGLFSDWPATTTFYANCMGLD